MGANHSNIEQNLAAQLDKRPGRSMHKCEEQLCDFPEIPGNSQFHTFPKISLSNVQGHEQNNVEDKENIQNIQHNFRRHSDIICMRARLSARRRLNSSPTGNLKMAPKISAKKCRGPSFPKNTPCDPDLITCCQNVAVFLSQAVANSKKNSSRRAGPSAEYIYSYMRFLFLILQLEPECCVYADIYLRRLLSNSKGALEVHAGNWHKMLVGACLLASKYTDDLSMNNKDFATALTGCTVQFMNRLESKYLHTLNWQVFIPISEYTTRYFELARKRNDERDWDAQMDRVKGHFTLIVD